MKKWIVIPLVLLMMLAGLALADGQLPAYIYPGDDPIEAAVAEYTAALGEGYLLEEGAVTIPAPLIFKVVAQDDTHTLVYGNFWVFNYVLEGKTLMMISGGEQPAVLTLTRGAEGWSVTEVDAAGDGEDYGADITRFCQGDEALLAQYFETDVESVRAEWIRAYVRANGLDIEAYKDYGWEPVSLELPQITGSLTEGGYVIRVRVAADDKGEWQADDMAQDPSVVTLTRSGLADGCFEARYDAAGDGEVTVGVRHFTGVACDRALTFDLLVEGGEVREVTGGSDRQSPSDEELRDVLCGTWLEADTQFTSLTLTPAQEGGFRAEAVSPMTHGAWVFTMTVRYDCELDALVYEDGELRDLAPDTDPDSAQSLTPRFSGICGRLAFTAGADGETLLLSWYPGLEDLEETLFARSEE